jgi:hypothetical protein
MFHKSRFVLAALAILLLGGALAQAQTTWTIDPTQSFATVQFQDTVIPATESPTASTLTLHLGNQLPPGTAGTATTPWTVGVTGALAGTIQTNYVDGTSIQFTPGGSMTGVNANTNLPVVVAPTGGGYIPAPSSWNGSNFGGNVVTAAPAMWGGSLSVKEIGGGVPQGYFNFQNTNFGLNSTVLPISGGGTFAANLSSLNLTQLDSLFLSGSALASDSYNVAVNPALNPHNHGLGTDGLPAPSWGGFNGLSTATIVAAGNLRTLTYQYTLIPNPGIGYFPVVFYNGSVPFIGAMTGQIVATTVVPEPSTLMMAGCGIAALGLCIRRKLRNK